MNFYFFSMSEEDFLMFWFITSTVGLLSVIIGGMMQPLKGFIGRSILLVLAVTILALIDMVSSDNRSAAMSEAIAVGFCLVPMMLVSWPFTEYLIRTERIEAESLKNMVNPQDMRRRQIKETAWLAISPVVAFFVFLLIVIRPRGYAKKLHVLEQQRSRHGRRKKKKVAQDENAPDLFEESNSSESGLFQNEPLSILLSDEWNITSETNLEM